MRLALDRIQVGVRARRDLGDLTSLASSIDEVGLLHPVVVTKDHRLIAGERRLRAVQSLGWESVDVRVLDLDEIARAERDENTERLDLSPSEAVALARALEPVERETARGRQAHGRTAPGRNAPAESAEASQTTRDRVAAAVGMGRSKLAKATEIVEAAEADANHADLVEQMDETGKVEPAHRELRSRRRPRDVDPRRWGKGPSGVEPRYQREERTCPSCGRFAPEWVLGGFAPPGDEDDWRYLGNLPVYGGTAKTREPKS